MTDSVEPECVVVAGAVAGATVLVGVGCGGYGVTKVGPGVGAGGAEVGVRLGGAEVGFGEFCGVTNVVASSVGRLVVGTGVYVGDVCTDFVVTPGDVTDTPGFVDPVDADVELVSFPIEKKSN